ncbi:hypothetical protein Strvi_3356 [Streptomyces violaceusniger Tu 4113]|uniref:Peptidase M48 domain-containing protein n=1 Tax=Streptomyces violaceusniger (strain Tu 4113) TaxID=653045 RepID=G2PE61_STRV4|nr:hypothetical protein Strvi_3356 [Streptomyces violaceusniger Tu 4113]
MLTGLDAAERRALFAHEHAHLARRRHHRFLLTVQLAARANPRLRESFWSGHRDQYQ